MKKYGKALTNIAVALAVVLLIIFVLPKVIVYFSPFVVGWIIALIAGPLVTFFEKKVKLKRKAGSAFVIIVVIGLVVFLLYLICAKLIEEGTGLMNSLPMLWASVEADFQDIAKNFDVIYRRFPIDLQNTVTEFSEKIGEYVGDFFSEISAPTITAVGNFAKQLPAVIIGIIMALLSSYFFVAERNLIGDWMRENMPSSVQKRYEMLKRSLGKAVGGYFKAQLKIEVWMYLLLVIGLSILHVDYALLIALGIAFMDFFPFFGTGTIMVPWAIIKIMSSDYQMALGLLIIWGVGQLARQIIQPKIVGDSVGVPPIPTLFLLYIGYKISGVIGMIVAVPMGLIVYTMYQEGVFDTTRKSVLILVSGINNFRKLRNEDMVLVEEMQKRERQKKQAMLQEEKKDAEH